MLVFAQFEGEDYVGQPDAAILAPTAGILGQQLTRWEVAKALVFVLIASVWSDWRWLGLGYWLRR